MISKKIAAFAGGVLFGTAGLKVLSSKDAKKVYTHTVTAIRENAGDILADAQQINEERQAAADEVVEDAAEGETEKDAQ